MWVCPKCGREFKRNNQSHYCGNPPATVDEYIMQQEIKAQGHLQALRAVIKNNSADVIERIAWSMPTYDRAGKSLSFAAGKSQISLYVGVDAVEMFQADLGNFVTKKSAVYLPYDRELPHKLLVEIVKCCLG